MAYANHTDFDLPRQMSPLMLCDRFLTLAQETDRAGFRIASEHLLYLALQVVDNPASLKN